MQYHINKVNKVIKNALINMMTYHDGIYDDDYVHYLHDEIMNNINHHVINNKIKINDDVKNDAIAVVNNHDLYNYNFMYFLNKNLN